MSDPDSSAKEPKPLPQRMERWKRILRFACSRGVSLRDRWRLFYYVGLKASLVFRGLARHAPERIVSISVRADDQRIWQVFARDNGLDVGTLAEFFQPNHAIIPPALPPFQPKVIYDLGANIGVASLYLSTLNPEARLYGFEPLPANYELCVLNYRNLPRSRAFPWAVGARSGTATFECRNDPRGGRLAEDVSGPGPGVAEKFQVQIFSIADLIEVQKLEPPDFLKIDVEGAELDVLKGLEGHIQTVNWLFVETHSAELKAGCAGWMQRHGFKMYAADDPAAVWGARV